MTEKYLVSCGPSIQKLGVYANDEKEAVITAIKAVNPDSLSDIYSVRKLGNPTKWGLTKWFLAGDGKPCHHTWTRIFKITICRWCRVHKLRPPPSVPRERRKRMDEIGLIKHREEQKRWRLADLARSKAVNKRYRAKHPQRSALYRKTFTGYFCEAYARIRKRCNSDSKAYAGLFVLERSAWMQFLEDTKAIRFALFQAWEKSGYQHRLSPSIDRLEPRLGYSVGNLRWMPQGQNSSEGVKAFWVRKRAGAGR